MTDQTELVHFSALVNPVVAALQERLPEVVSCKVHAWEPNESEYGHLVCSVLGPQDSTRLVVPAEKHFDRKHLDDVSPIVDQVFDHAVRRGVIEATDVSTVDSSEDE